MSSTQFLAAQSFTDIDLASLEATAELVAAALPIPTPSIRWPLLEKSLGLAADATPEVWVKHENHLPTGAFKVRGGVRYFNWLKKAHPEISGVIAATRGNHGQSVAFAAAAAGMRATIVVPSGNSEGKNAAMRAYGAELIERGADFNEAMIVAQAMAAERGLHMVPSFDWKLVEGVATYGLELFRKTPPLDRLYVPIGLGSGICGCLAARRALGLENRTQVIGVVAEAAPCYKKSFESGALVETEGAPQTIADGVACRVPNAEALEVILKRVTRIVSVSEAAIRASIKSAITDMHQLCEGAAALPFAALAQEASDDPDGLRGQRVALVMSGGNVGHADLLSILR